MNDIQNRAFENLCSNIKTDVSWLLNSIERAQLSPSVLYRPKISIDGNQWCALYGENLQDGVAGFGDTPILAMLDFDNNFKNQKIEK